MMKNIKILFALIIGMASLSLYAQVAVSTDGSSADASAMLDVKSTSKGVLITRMTQNQRNSISSPATGLMIYQTDNTPGFYYYAGSGWTQLGANVDLSAYAEKTNVLELDNTSSYTPTANYHPATKLYVDNSVPSLTSYALKTDVLTKTNTSAFTPSSNYHPATKSYVDGKASQWTTSGSNIYYNTGNVGIGSLAGTNDVKLLIKKAGKIGWNYGTSGNTCHAWISKDGTGPMIFENSYGGTSSSYDHYDFRVGSTSALTIQGDRFVGVGTVDPKQKLHVSEGSSGQSNPHNVTQLVVESNEWSGVSFLSPYGTYIMFGDAASNEVGKISYSHSNNRMYFGTNGLSNTLILEGDGDVGISINSPGYKLHVNGTVAGVGSYVNASDKRLKKDIKPIDSALDKVLALQGVTFNWNKTVKTEMEFDDKNHIGFLAQDLEEVLPQVVYTAEDEMQSKSVAYGDVVPVLVEAIKEQQKQIEALKIEIENLKK